MKRKLVLGVALAGAILSMHVGGLQSVAWSQWSIPSTTPLVTDSFTDNKKGGKWKVFANDPNNCRVTEVNERLEFTGAQTDSDPFAGYVSNGWWIDTRYDFAMKVDLHFDVVSAWGGGAWIYFGFARDLEKPRDKCLSLGIGSVTYARNYFNELKEGTIARTDLSGRWKNDVTLYISYSAYHDELYLSDRGYGPTDAWQTYKYLVWGEWERPHFYPYLGGIMTGSPVEAGHAYIDNFVIEQGVIGGVIPPDPPSTPTTPTDPNDPGGVGQDVNSPVVVLPSIIERSDIYSPVTAATTLPIGICRTDIDESEPLLLMPGNVKAENRTIFVWLNGQVIVAGSFDRANLMQAIPGNGAVDLQLVGKLKGGYKFSGTCRVTIR